VLTEKLESPAVTNLTATFSAAPADASPLILPDLYRGEPVALTAKVGALNGTLEIKGFIGERPWTVTIPLANAAEGEGLSKLWARRKIADAEVARTLHRISQDEADKRILALALEHHLVTRLTSLIAIDKTPSRPDGLHLTRADIPLNLPAGWDFDKVFGHGRASTPAERPTVPVERRADLTGADRPAQVLSYASVRQSNAARPAPQGAATPASNGVVLPKTATDAELRLWFGLLACFLSLILFAFAWRRRATAGGLAR
jgi:Ca-activated chloride channel family protein